MPLDLASFVWKPLVNDTLNKQDLDAIDRATVLVLIIT